MTPAPQADRIDSKLDNKQEGTLVRFGLGLANWSERWFPDPLVFAFIGIVVVFIAGLLLRESPSKLAIAGGKSFWSLVPFTMQMVMIIIGGYVVASTPLVYGAIRCWRACRNRRAQPVRWWRCSPCSRRSSRGD